MRSSERLSTLLSIHLDLDTLDERHDQACDNLLDWRARGYPSTSLAVSAVGRGRVNDPTLHALSTPDYFDREIREADERLRRVHEDMRWLARFAYRNTETTPIVDSFPCENPHCDRTVTGDGEDRLREGRCPRCYRYWLRWGKRKEWGSEEPG